MKAGNLKGSKRRQTAPNAKSFNCPSCGAALSITAVGQTINVSCHSCHAVIDVTNENYQILQKASKQRNVLPDIPLGTRGKLKGIKWEVIGFMQRSDKSGVYKWKEYLLFNPYQGFRWLMEFDGHWNFIKSSKAKPNLAEVGVAKLNNMKFDLFHRGVAKVLYVEGEFYWRVKAGETRHVADYISAPYLLSYESGDYGNSKNQEETWSISKYIEEDKIKKAFNLKTLPHASGVAPNQPMPLSKETKAIKKEAYYFLGIILLILFFRLCSADRDLVFNIKKNFRPTRSNPTDDNIPLRPLKSFGLKATKKMSIITDKFEIKGSKSNVAIYSHASLKNNWLYFDTLLVNAKTGKGLPASQGLEYYSGYSGGESWSEGSRSGSKVIYNVPKGTYYLNLIIESGNHRKSTPFALRVKRDILIWSNAAWAIVLILIIPLLLWWRKRRFEVERWSSSDYSPYYSEDDDY